MRGAQQRDALRHVRRPGARRAHRADPDARHAARRAGNTTIDGLDATQTWTGVEYTAEQFRSDANVLDGVELMGDGSVADLLWARPSATVLGHRRPPVIGSSSAVQAAAAARVSLRIPPGMTGQDAQDALVAHLRVARARGACAARSSGSRRRPVRRPLDGPAFEALKAAMEEA